LQSYLKLWKSIFQDNLKWFKNVKSHTFGAFFPSFAAPHPIMSKLAPHYYKDLVEAGCDEAGRGCLAGSVFAAAVILPPDYDNPDLNDSKKLTEKRRYALREQIQRDALAWAVGTVTPQEIDRVNILHASFLAMHRALDQLQVRPEALIIDGNRFDPYVPKHSADHQPLPYTCIVKGDGRYQAIAAASILAKTYRDDYMDRLAEEYPYYDWQSNKGYPTAKHREGIRLHGTSPYHRRSFNLLGDRQLEIDFGDTPQAPAATASESSDPSAEPSAPASANPQSSQS
jgi:ribonuclease HII